MRGEIEAILAVAMHVCIYGIVPTLLTDCYILAFHQLKDETTDKPQKLVLFSQRKSRVKEAVCHPVPNANPLGA